MTCKGVTRKAMARTLQISINSVDKYSDRLHKKVGVKDRVGLVLKALKFVLQKRELEL